VNGGNHGPGPDAAVFRERQRFGPWWVWVLLGVGVVAAWTYLVVAVAGDEPLAGPMVLVATIGIALPVFFAVARLDVAVYDDRVEIDFFPLRRRTIALRDVAGARARRYRPVREYGGWGIKGWSTKKIAYNVRGDHGVELTLHDGRTVLIGSQHAGELAAAVGRGSAPPADPIGQPPS